MKRKFTHRGYMGSPPFLCVRCFPLWAYMMKLIPDNRLAHYNIDMYGFFFMNILSSPFITLTNLRYIQHCIYWSTIIRYRCIIKKQEHNDFRQIILVNTVFIFPWCPDLSRLILFLSRMTTLGRFLTGRKAMTKSYISISFVTHICL